MITMYIDPGTGSMLISATVALISVGFFMLKGIVYRKFGIGGSKGDLIDPSERRHIAIYSEGKQYWNVFKNIVDGCIEQDVELTYLSSDSEDPGLNYNNDKIEAKYIGSGREAFYVLNRLNAAMVILTTPGLDVLEIKRSKDVDHYVHITHATGTIADYKAYGVDYFDTVLLGGEGDVEVIRELEAVRSLPQKNIEIVGHTYLDVLREKMDHISSDDLLFNNDRKTVLVSPTWGIYSLIHNGADELLENLCSLNYNVIVRPHPQSFNSDAELIKELMAKYPDNENIKWDIGTDNIYAMLNADIMISDYSGIIFDFYSLFEKPILTMQSLFKKEGLDAMDLKEDAWNLTLLNQIGVVITQNNISDIDKILLTTLNEKNKEVMVETGLIDKMSMYPKQSKHNIINFIHKTLPSTDKDNLLNVEENDTREYRSSKLLIFLSSLVITSAIFLIGTILMTGELIPQGNSKVYFSQLLKYSKISLLLSTGILVSYLWIVEKGKVVFFNDKEKPKLTQWVMALIPLIPIAQYIISNQDILGALVSIQLLLYFSLISILLIVVVPFILSILSSVQMTSSFVTAFLFTVFNMASYGTDMRGLYITGIMGVVFIGLYALQMLKKDKLLIVLSIILIVTNSVISVKGNLFNISDNSDLSEKDQEFIKYIDTHKVVSTANIYLLTYDSYVNEETYKAYGFDNSGQFEYLLNQGFAIYDGTYSIGHASLKSMSNVVQTTNTPVSNSDERRLLSGLNTSMYFMNKNKYSTHVVLPSDYMYQGYTSQYDYTFPSNDDLISPKDIIINAVLEGEFRNDAEFSEVTYEEFSEFKEQSLGEVSLEGKNPIFYYTHDDKPGHTSFNKEFTTDVVSRYLNSVENINLQMQKEIDLIKKVDPEAIVVIMGDHGPYITNGGYNSKNEIYKDLSNIDLQDRYGAFLAISWPNSDYVEKYDIKVIQDVIPAIFSYLYNDDSLFEELRVTPDTIKTNRFKGIAIKDGVVVGGPDDGKPLFEHRGVRYKK